MKIKSFLLTALAASALAVGSASANVIVAYSGKLEMFSDTGASLMVYATGLSNVQDVVTDSTGHVYVAEYGTPGSFNGNVKMYDIASGAFIRNVVQGAYNVSGLAFNPANSGQIIMIGQYNATQSQLGRWTTSVTNSAPGANSLLGKPYGGLYYNPTISGGAPEGIYAAAPAGAVQQYNSSTLAWGSPTIPDIGVTGPQDITGVGTDLFFASNNGHIYKYSGGTLTDFKNTASSNYGITTDGVNSLWVAQYSANNVAQYNAATGTLGNYFSVTAPAGIAYTTIPEPATWALLALSLTVVVTLRRRRTA